MKRDPVTVICLLGLLLVMAWVVGAHGDVSKDDLRFGQPHICNVMGLAFVSVGDPLVNNYRHTWAFLDAKSGVRVHGVGQITCLAVPPPTKKTGHDASTMP